MEDGFEFPEDVTITKGKTKFHTSIKTEIKTEIEAEFPDDYNIAYEPPAFPIMTRSRSRSPSVKSEIKTEIKREPTDDVNASPYASKSSMMPQKFTVS